jgi:endonuclease YncB( thermonuclease family)
MKRLNAKDLIKKRVPRVLIPGIIAAIILGPAALNKVRDYYELKQVFPVQGTVAGIEDGDTFSLRGGQRIRLLGIDAPPGTPTRAENYLVEEIMNKKVYLEYDRYQDDKFGRILAWVWVGCEKTPNFLPADYMHKSAKESMPGLTDNPEGCKKGELINEELVKQGFAETVSYKDRGPLKYSSRLQNH